MVDNFEKIRPLLRFEQPGDCYYVQLLRRQSDDPMINGLPDPDYHGNMHSRSLKDYLIDSLEKFDRKREEIKKLCDTFNVRAYIRLNKRTYNKISMSMLKHIVDQLSSGQSFNSPFSLVASAAGLSNCAGTDKTWILDLDAEYLLHLPSIKRMLLNCKPIDQWFLNWKDLRGIDKEANDENTIMMFFDMCFPEVKTKNGLHLISRPFNICALNDQWQKYVQEHHVPAPLPQHKIEEAKDENGNPVPYYVFSLTDYYLKHADEFVKICKFHAQTEKIVIDKNKVVVHYHSSLFGELENDWTRYCAQASLGMKMFDVHKDNPTILYVP